MSTKVQFWVDPACPWCWMTAQWVVGEVEPHRDLDITWQPISLLFKNQPDPESPYYGPALTGHRLLRVMQNVRTHHGETAAKQWYLRSATGIHHEGWGQQSNIVDQLGRVLAELGFDPELAAAATDEQFDDDIMERMDQGIALVGNDVGTPIISFTDEHGVERGIFGPVISEVPRGDAALAFWDAMLVFANNDAFWELKRTRTRRPDLSTRPNF